MAKNRKAKQRKSKTVASAVSTESEEPSIKDVDVTEENEVDGVETSVDEEKIEKTVDVIATTESVESNVVTNKFFSGKKFSELGLSEKIVSSLEANGFSKMTEIQHKSIPLLLQGKDLLGAAKTGSGKTLAFLVPAIDLLYKTSFKPKNGTGCIIITPTRELAIQIYEVLTNLLSKGVSSTPDEKDAKAPSSGFKKPSAEGFPQTHSLCIGGNNRKVEARKLQTGVNFLVATPGRLLDHLRHAEFVTRNLLMLIIDEADRLLEIGFEEDLTQILRLLPTKRQTLLFSATQDEKVEQLAKLSIKTKPVFVDVRSGNDATPETLSQGYVCCPPQKRFLLLYSFLKRLRKKKALVFLSSCASVKFHSELLNFVDLKVSEIHGKQKQNKRTQTFFDFCSSESGIMLCTDVAARGLDIPNVDWIIQYDPPDDPKEYIHRVGRAARGESNKGKALLFLTPSELGFIAYLNKSKVDVMEYEFPKRKVRDVQSQLEKLVRTNYYLHRSAKDAYRGYLLSYASHSHKDIFDVEKVDLVGCGKAFGFTVPPNINLNLSDKGRKSKKRKGDGKDWAPKRQTDGPDKRQFVYH